MPDPRSRPCGSAGQP